MIFYILKTKSTSDHYEIMKVKSRCKGHFYLQNIFNFELQFFVVSVSVVLEGNSIDDVCSLFELFALHICMKKNFHSNKNFPYF